MKFTSYLLRFTICAVLCLLAAITAARAELTATVTPGHQFSANEQPTASTLNLLGTPTVEITGTLGGTNVALGAATVSGTMLMDSVAGSNLNWNSSSPRGLVIADSGVGTNQISVDIAGLGLGGGGGFALSNKVDGVRLTIVSDTVTFSAATNALVGGSGTNYNVHVGNGLLLTNGDLSVPIGNGLQYSGGAITVSNTTFTTSEASLGVGSVTDTAHSLPMTPTFVRWVLVCKSSNVGYSVGDEVDVAGFVTTAGAQVFASGANSSNVFLVQTTSAIHTLTKSTGADASINTGSWRAKGYARY